VKLLLLTCKFFMSCRFFWTLSKVCNFVCSHDWSCCPAWIWLKGMKSIPKIRPLSPIYISVFIMICSQKLGTAGGNSPNLNGNSRLWWWHDAAEDWKCMVRYSALLQSWGQMVLRLPVGKKISSKSQSCPDPIMFGVIYKLLFVYLFWQYNCCYPRAIIVSTYSVF